MSLRKDMRAALLEILKTGITRIRNFGHAGDAAACNREAYHIHNLPHLVGRLSLDEIEYYLTIEREEFLRGDPQAKEYFAPAWDRLASLVRAARASRWRSWLINRMK